MKARRIAAALLPLPGLLSPATAHQAGAVTIAICSGSTPRTITLPPRDVPLPGPDERQGCAHFLCPRERGSVAEDDEDAD